jgi:hypothetical protein
MKEHESLSPVLKRHGHSGGHTGRVLGFDVRQHNVLCLTARDGRSNGITVVRSARGAVPDRSHPHRIKICTNGEVIRSGKNGQEWRNRCVQKVAEKPSKLVMRLSPATVKQLAADTEGSVTIIATHNIAALQSGERVIGLRKGKVISNR